MTKYLIIGGTGSLGKKLIDRLLPNNQIIVYSRDEAKQWTIKNDLQNSTVLQNRLHDIKFFVGDIRDEKRLQTVIHQTLPQVIIVAAALKQVDTCEFSPEESMLTNLIGTQNVINATAFVPNHLVRTVLFVSTDKACSPVNVYGMCKALSERLITSQESYKLNPKFLCVRYGNVLESRGSIIPLFKYQAENAQQLTLTDQRMTRFIMTLDDAVDLILKAIVHGNPGETWLPKLDAMKIIDLAEIFAEQHKKDIKIIGLRPGEKLHEDLLNEVESYRTVEKENSYVILPAHKPVVNNKCFKLDSSKTLSKSQLLSKLQALNILQMKLENFKGLSIEEIKK